MSCFPIDLNEQRGGSFLNQVSAPKLVFAPMDADARSVIWRADEFNTRSFKRALDEVEVVFPSFWDACNLFISNNRCSTHSSTIRKFLNRPIEGSAGGSNLWSS
jgi:hypothetical protein